jgi:hypothetical protein
MRVAKRSEQAWNGARRLHCKFLNRRLAHGMGRGCQILDEHRIALIQPGLVATGRDGKSQNGERGPSQTQQIQGVSRAAAAGAGWRHALVLFI